MWSGCGESEGEVERVGAGVRGEVSDGCKMM